MWALLTGLGEGHPLGCRRFRSYEGKNMEVPEPKEHLNVCVLKDPRLNDILETCLYAFDLVPLKRGFREVSLEQLGTFLQMRALKASRDEIWYVLWTLSNLRLRYVPKRDSLKWDGSTFRDKSVLWSLDRHPELSK